MTSKYIYTVWKKKTASAQVKLFSWKWESIINEKKLDDYVSRKDLFDIIFSPLKLCKVKEDSFFEVKVSWSWITSQAYAIRHWLSIALAEKDEAFRKILKVVWFLTRDSRKVERKKPGRHKARKWMQWSKR